LDGIEKAVVLALAAEIHSGCGFCAEIAGGLLRLRCLIADLEGSTSANLASAASRGFSWSTTSVQSVAQ
jgi:hypothetical protein